MQKCGGLLLTDEAAFSDRMACAQSEILQSRSSQRKPSPGTLKCVELACQRSMTKGCECGEKLGLPPQSEFASRLSFSQQLIQRITLQT